MLARLSSAQTGRGVSHGQDRLLAGNDFSAVMDASWFPGVTETWRAVLPPNHVLLIAYSSCSRRQWAC
jgi:hypothetical protein